MGGPVLVTVPKRPLEMAGTVLESEADADPLPFKAFPLAVEFIVAEPLEQAFHIDMKTRIRLLEAPVAMRQVIVRQFFDVNSRPRLKLKCNFGTLSKRTVCY